MGFFDNLSILDFWSLGVILLILIAWAVLARLGHRFRSWVVPTFCAIALIGNIATLIFIDRSPDYDNDTGISDEYDEDEYNEDELEDDDEDEDTEEDDEDDEDADEEPDTGIREITISINDALRGTVDINRQEAEQGTNIVLRAAANAGYEFYKWEVVSGDAALANSLSPNTSFTMPDTDVYIMAYFEAIPQNFTISVAATDPAFGSAQSDLQSATSGTQVRVTATANIGFEFDRWEVVLGTITLADANSETTTFTMPDNDVSVRATFKPIVYNISVSSANQVHGIAEVTPSDASIGDRVTITATANPGFTFDRWEVLSGGAVVSNISSPTETITMPASDVTIRAHFREMVFIVTTSVSGEGTVIASTYAAQSGATVGITATSAAGFEFYRWEVVTGNTTINNPNSNQTSFQMPQGDVIVMAIFTEVTS